MCYDCLYNAKICHRKSVSIIYKNAKIYTVDENTDPNWDK